MKKKNSLEMPKKSLETLKRQFRNNEKKSLETPNNLSWSTLKNRFKHT